MLPCGLLALGPVPGQPARICFFLPSHWTLLKLSTQSESLTYRERKIMFQTLWNYWSSEEPCISYLSPTWIKEPCFQQVTLPTCSSEGMWYLLEFLPLQIMLIMSPLHPSVLPFHLWRSKSGPCSPLWPSSNDSSPTVPSYLPQLNTSSLLGLLGCCFHHSGVTWMPCRYLYVNLSPIGFKTHWW